MSRPQRMNSFYFLDTERQRPDPADKSETAHWMQFAYEQNLLIKKVWSELFLAELGDIPPQLTAPGSGQFAVTSASIRRHPRIFYQVGQYIIFCCRHTGTAFKGCERAQTCLVLQISTGKTVYKGSHLDLRLKAKRKNLISFKILSRISSC